jgi:hypothetical protein
MAEQIGVSPKALPAKPIFVLRLQFLFELPGGSRLFELIGDRVKNPLKCFESLRVCASQNPSTLQCPIDTISKRDLVIKPGLTVTFDN